MKHPKIFPLEALSAELDRHRKQKIVLCHGVFDLLHIGHIRHLKEAKSLGDLLVVTLTPDEYVNKGTHRPIFTADYRAEVLATLDVVDYVAVNGWPTGVETIKLLRPDFYVKGVEYRKADDDKTDGIELERRAVEAVGGKLCFTDDIVFSSSNLINRYLSPLPKTVQDYLAGLRTRFTTQELIGWLERAENLRVLALGETILDEYVLCESLGKSGKDPILAVRYNEEERYAGGILAVANHLAGFAQNVALVSLLGRDDPQEEFVRSRLDPNVRAHFLLDKGPTIVKRRFVERYPFQKLFEIYYMNGCEESPEISEALRALLRVELPQNDLVVVADYGHGMLDPETRALLSDQAKFLAVNTQVNAGNLGFNMISKYQDADFVSISEKELRMETRSRTKPLETLVKETAQRLNCPRWLITQGGKGCLCFQASEGFFRVPAFTAHIVDRTGAGDTVLAIASLCVAQGAPMEVAAFLGNLAGAQAVGMICNEKPIARLPLIQQVISLLK